MKSRIHPTAIIEDDVKIGRGTAVWDNVHIRYAAQIGEQCIIGVAGAGARVLVGHAGIVARG